MTFTQYFKISSYCLITSGFAAIAATGSIDFFSLFLFCSALVGSWFIDTAGLRQRIPNWVLNCLVLSYIPFFIIDYKLLSHSFVITTIHLIFFVAAVKLLTLAQDRDYVYLYIISFAELLAASTLTVDIIFAACFFFFLLSGISTLFLFEMRRSNAATQAAGKVQPLVVPRNIQGTGLELLSPFPSRLVTAMVLGMTLLILAVAAPLFFLLPRISLGYYSRPSGRTRLLSGFSDHVDLGVIGTIKESDAVVMRVKLNTLTSEVPAKLKWRGVSLDYYDGRSWRRTDLHRRTVREQGRYYKLEEYSQSTNILVQTYFMEALSTNVVFASHKVLAVSSDIGFLQRDSAGNLYTRQHPFHKIRYIAVSNPIDPNPLQISSLEAIPAEIRDKYLQLPPGDGRIADLAKDVTKTATDRYAKAKALEQYLFTHYTYSLDLSRNLNSQDPLAVFLFDVQKGHCEYFASAMTIMLRQLGIPARLVNGFRSGEYNSFSHSWIVRQYDAHSWVEAYFPPYGWIEFDPTPPDPRRFRPALTQMFSNLLDAIDLWWWESVVNYDFSQRYQLVSNLRSKLAEFQRNLISALAFAYQKAKTGVTFIGTQSKWSSAGGKWVLGIFLFILVAFWLVAKFWRRRIFRSIQRLLHGNNQAIVIAGFYAEALELLRTYGMIRSRSQTPLEFAASLGDHPAAMPFTDLTHLYNRIRFGSSKDPLHTSQAEAFLHSMREALRFQAGQHL